MIQRAAELKLEWCSSRDITVDTQDKRFAELRFSAEMILGNPRGRFPGLVSRPYEASYGHEYESYAETDDTMTPSSVNGEVSRGYVRTRLAPPHPQPTEYYGLERSGSQRSGPYESYDSGSSKGSRDLFRSGGFRSSFDGGYDSSSPSNRFYSEESSWDSSYPSSATRSGFSDNDGGGGYSSYSSSDSPHTKLAPFGSRGRGMPAYPQNSFGGRSNDVGGPPAFRGRGRGVMVVEEVCLSKVEMILCLACHTHIPAALISLQNHLQSSEHLKNKSEFTETQRRESVLSATSIMNNPIVKARFEKYLKLSKKWSEDRSLLSGNPYEKGENPFDDEIKEAPEDSQHDQAEDDLNDSTK
ncbi:hypothetical protein SKAU_G00201890 [Synaphobranchus kaupii]|uniref:Uncharacterized protein n=1 Tax=Synaphobranchus kaupii TaxID=118154 RepID=A0A9Q1FG06_SYNKA|nr:hypothetical protein SKAU_G00201890 [Synaphobranchus kaupii]